MRIQNIFLGLAFLVVPALLCLAADPAIAEDKGKPRIALAAHSYHELNLNRLLPRAAKLGVEHMEFSDRHFSVFASDRDIERMRYEFRKNGITPVSTFTAFFSEDEAANRRIFEVAQALGLEFIAAVPDPALLPALSRLVEEFGVGVAVHNGAPSEPYGTVDKVLAVLAEYPAIDTVADVGYYAKAGIDPAEAVRRLAEANRLREVHAKDLISVTMPEEDQPYTVVGSGVIDWPAIAGAIEQTGYDGLVTLEYTGQFWDYLEREPKLAASLGYLRGLFAEGGVDRSETAKRPDYEN